MQERGVEPLHLAVQDPKSCASANSATPALQPNAIRPPPRVRIQLITVRPRAGSAGRALYAVGRWRPDGGWRFANVSQCQIAKAPQPGYVWPGAMRRVGSLDRI